ncbi:MAG: CHAD domain-containing protein [Solirubrobacteraceae bacterium]|nr:CHAD domain-containing protein [Solirubrobacteraceae bacterium]
MAKAREIPGLTPELPFTLAAARTVAVRAAELFDHLDGVLDVTDIERVHDARVATRRLRAVLELYAPCFPPEPFGAALRDVKALADALGARRDPDVHLAALTEFADAATPADRPGLRLLLDRIADEQEEGNVTLARALMDVREHALRERLAMLVESAGGVEGA